MELWQQNSYFTTTSAILALVTYTPRYTYSTLSNVQNKNCKAKKSMGIGAMVKLWNGTSMRLSHGFPNSRMLPATRLRHSFAFTIAELITINHKRYVVRQSGRGQWKEFRKYAAYNVPSWWLCLDIVFVLLPHTYIHVLTFVSIARVSWSWKCSFNFDLPSSLEPRNCENLYCQTMAESAPSASEKPDCQSKVRPPPLPWCETAKVLRCGMWHKRE